MIFYEFLRTHLGNKIEVSLKNGMNLSGILNSIDPFLNIKLTNTKFEEQNPAIQEMDICSVRGSSIKWMDLQKNPKVDERLSHATILKFSLDK
jgi:U6 snRNA-associated Sm-like protein LSm2